MDRNGSLQKAQHIKGGDSLDYDKLAEIEWDINSADIEMDSIPPYIQIQSKQACYYQVLFGAENQLKYDFIWGCIDTDELYMFYKDKIRYQLEDENEKGISEETIEDVARKEMEKPLGQQVEEFFDAGFNVSWAEDEDYSKIENIFTREEAVEFAKHHTTTQLDFKKIKDLFVTAFPELEEEIEYDSNSIDVGNNYIIYFYEVLDTLKRYYQTIYQQVAETVDFPVEIIEDDPTVLEKLLPVYNDMTGNNITYIDPESLDKDDYILQESDSDVLSRYFDEAG